MYEATPFIYSCCRVDILLSLLLLFSLLLTYKLPNPAIKSSPPNSIFIFSVPNILSARKTLLAFIPHEEWAKQNL